jgi:predicted dehydrogenase
MNLTPEQREIGKQNFNEAVGTTRRDFLTGTVLAAGAAGTASLGAMYFGYGASVENPLRVGIIGTGDEGGVLIGALNPDYVSVVAIADIRPYNIHRGFHGHRASPGTFKARPGLMEVYGWSTEDEARKNVKVYEESYEELIKDPDVEAVIIALPLWLHDTAAIKAMRAGKHVLTEKLMAKTVARCKEMSRVAEETGLILATGHQRHYSVLYDNAVDQIKRGLLGDLHHIRAQWHRGNLPGSDSWSPPMPTKILTADEYAALRRKARGKNDAAGKAAETAFRREYKILETLFSLDRALDDAKKRKQVSKVEDLEKRVAETQAQLRDAEVNAAAHGYEAKTLPSGYQRTPLEELIRWRLWERTGAGLMAELGSHQLDAASIFVSSQRDDGEKVYPLSVQGFSHRSLFPEDREVDDHVHCNFEFPAKGYYKDFASGTVADPNRKLVVTYSSINGNGFGGYGEVVLGTKGTLILEQEKDALLFKGSDASAKIEVKDGDSPALSTYETGGGAAVAEVATPKEVSRGYREEIEHWAWCIRNPDPKNQPRCKPKVAMADAVIALTSNLAMARGEKIAFQKEWFEIDKDDTPEGDKPRPTSELG